MPATQASRGMGEQMDGAIGAPPQDTETVTARVLTLHRSRRGVVLLAARIVLLPVCAAVIGQNLASIGDWQVRTWAASILLGCYMVAAFVELVRSFGVTELAVVDGDLVLWSPTLLQRAVRVPAPMILDAHVTPN